MFRESMFARAIGRVDKALGRGRASVEAALGPRGALHTRTAVALAIGGLVLIAALMGGLAYVYSTTKLTFVTVYLGLKTAKWVLVGAGILLIPLWRLMSARAGRGAGDAVAGALPQPMPVRSGLPVGTMSSM